MNIFYDFYLKRREELIKRGLSVYEATRIAYNEAMGFYTKSLLNLSSPKQTFILKEI